ncbi:cyclodeaminase/cyclohydrolase family protein [Haloplanus ruber]|uniref:Cyclodeaminase/cyclohydrolase family protein n=1 Tax=Haloplanus ruber TaxID=869892 RepID=A0ABD6CYI6_9EURY
MTDDTRALGRLLDDVASASAAPAGGTAAAVTGALGTALCEMVCLHTDGNEAGTLADVRADLRITRDHLTDLAAADASVVDDLFASDGNPSEAGRKRAVGVPLTTAAACLTALELVVEATERGTPPTVADAATGVLLIDAALRASLRTARHNLSWVADPVFVAGIEERAARIDAQADDARHRALEHADR